MKRSFTQLELIKLLETNPLHIKVYYAEVDKLGEGDYIFLDGIQDIPIANDNSACYQEQVQISIYCKQEPHRKKTVQFVKDNFLCSVVKRKDEENEYYVADCTTSLFILDW